MLDGDEPVTGRPADDIEPEMERQVAEFRALAKDKGIRVADDEIDDVLTYALFPQIGTRFLENRDNPDAFEPEPNPDAVKSVAPSESTEAPGAAVFTTCASTARVSPSKLPRAVNWGTSKQRPRLQPRHRLHRQVQAKPLKAVLAGNIFKVNVSPGEEVAEGQALLVVEAMKMETAVSAPRSGIITDVFVSEGDVVAVGDSLVAIS